MKHVKTEEREKIITIEVTETELDFIVVSVGRISRHAAANEEAKNYSGRKIDLSSLDNHSLWADLRKCSGLEYHRN